MGNTERTRSNNVELGVFESQTEKNEDILRFKKTSVIVLKKQRKEAEKIFKNCNLDNMTDKEIEELLTFGVNPNMENKNKESILSNSIANGRENLVRKCLELGADPNKKGTCYKFENKKRISLKSPLFESAVKVLSACSVFTAIFGGGAGFVSLAIESHFFNAGSVGIGMVCGLLAGVLAAEDAPGVKIDYVDYKKKHYFKQSYLMAAVEKGNENIVKLLLEYGANPYVLDENGTTPLAMADKKGYKGCYQLIESARNECQLVGTTQHKLLGERKANAFADFDDNSFEDSEKMPITVARRGFRQQSNAIGKQRED